MLLGCFSLALTPPRVMGWQLAAIGLLRTQLALHILSGSRAGLPLGTGQRPLLSHSSLRRWHESM
eukprot:12915700-Prorocentrum_lima.AAC.1